MRPTTKDLAKAAGVSLATVDRVLNDRTGVRPDTVEKVQHAIEKLGFSRNLVAANLARGKIYRFLFLLPRTGDLFLAGLISRIDEANLAFAAEMMRAEVAQIHESDPHQIANLASQPDHRATLERMRKSVVDWMTRVGDQGLVNEAEMIQRMWPGGVQPETAQPYIVARRTTDAPARAEHMTIDAPMEVVIYVPTQGASIGYTTEDGPTAKWRLYTGPIRVDSAMTLRAKAIRYGYKESKETRVVVQSARPGAER